MNHLFSLTGTLFLGSVFFSTMGGAQPSVPASIKCRTLEAQPSTERDVLHSYLSTVNSPFIQIKGNQVATLQKNGVLTAIEVNQFRYADGDLYFLALLKTPQGLESFRIKAVAGPRTNEMTGVRNDILNSNSQEISRSSVPVICTLR